MQMDACHSCRSVHRVWVVRGRLVRLEAHLGNTMKVAGGLVGGVAKGSAVVLEQAKVNDEVWLPTYQEIHLSVRLLMLHGNANRIERYSDCKKFRADSTFTVGQN